MRYLLCGLCLAAPIIYATHALSQTVTANPLQVNPSQTDEIIYDDPNNHGDFVIRSGVGGNDTYYDFRGNGTLSILNGGLSVVGIASASGATLGGNGLTVSGPSNFNGGFSVGGGETISGASQFYALATMNNGLTVAGGTLTAGSGGLTVNGPSNFNGGFSVGGGETIAGPAAFNAIATFNAGEQLSAGQKVCLNGNTNCITYSSSVGKFYFTNSSGANVASIDNNGNLIVAGQIFQKANP